MIQRNLFTIIFLFVFCAPVLAQYTGGPGSGAASASSDEAAIAASQNNMPSPIEAASSQMPVSSSPVPITKTRFICPSLFIILALLVGAGILLAAAFRKKLK